MARLLLVSNRLPVTVTRGPEGFVVTPSIGGVATGLLPLHEQRGGRWIGWPGDLPGLRPQDRGELRARLQAQAAVPVFLSRTEVRKYYQGFANGVLWPLFHYLLDQIPLSFRDWDAYVRVNQRFADAALAHYKPGDTIWVHDYHLLLVPGMIRRQIPRARIGLFLHIPFPSHEVLRLLPWREEILRGMLGADLIGFHTPSYLRHFSTSALQILGVEVNVDLVQLDRPVQLGVFPMGVDAARFGEMAARSEVQAAAQYLRATSPGMQLLVAIDRMDYTKGILRRLLAFERLLQAHPDLRGRVRLVQVVAPSRLNVRAYRSFARRVDELVSRVNGAYGTLGVTPIHYLRQSVDLEGVVVTYLAADALVVTPLRDGMNLVSKEFVASRIDGDGVLVLSEFAGASHQLADAIPINPYDVDGTAEAMRRALRMPEAERRSRMARLRASVSSEDVHWWARSFLEALETAAESLPGESMVPGSPWQEQTLRRAAGASRLTLLLDYDGTLVPFHGIPEDAVPDEELRDLLGRLSRRPGVSVQIVSGRRREQLEDWLGDLPIGLHAEHGLHNRWSLEEGWTGPRAVDSGWKAKVLPLLQEFAGRTRGAIVEEKEASLVWHYRRSDPLFGSQQAKELRLHLLELLSNQPVRILPGDRIVEVRAYDVHKGIVVLDLLQRASDPGLILALGDDRTDEDMFAALPEGAVAIRVGPSPAIPGPNLPGPEAVRAFLRGVLSLAPAADGSGETAVPSPGSPHPRG